MRFLKRGYGAFRFKAGRFGPRAGSCPNSHFGIGRLYDACCGLHHHGHEICSILVIILGNFIKTYLHFGRLIYDLQYRVYALFVEQVPPCREA